MSVSIENAKALFEAGKYEDAAQMCVKLSEDSSELKEVWLVMGKSILQTIPNASCEKLLEEVYECLNRALDAANSIEEANNIWVDFQRSWHEWKKSVLVSVNNSLIERPTTENMNAVLKHATALSMADVSVRFTAEYNMNVKKLVSEAETSTSVIYKGEVSTTEWCEFEDRLMYETAKRMFLKAQDFFTKNQHINREAMGELFKPLADTFTAALCYYDPLKRDENKKYKTYTTEEVLERYANFAERIRFPLELRFIMEGNPVAIYTESEYTNQKLCTLKKVYTKMQQLDPNFVIPSMPQIAKSNNITTSGGCYIATAVYGSYDCPQVWTLRRYRDFTLAETWYGRAIIRIYYAISPTLVKWFGHTNWFRKMWQGKLDRMVAKLQKAGIESSPYEDKAW